LSCDLRIGGKKKATSSGETEDTLRKFLGDGEKRGKRWSGIAAAQKKYKDTAPII